MFANIMPRANRYILEGQAYHLTDRCHDRSFLLKFALDRNEYRKRMRAALKGSGVWLLSHSITSNHVHLLVTVRSLSHLSRFMQGLQGEFAQWYNTKRRRSGAFWEGRYHSTMIQSGAHLWNCMAYIDMNMVRAGVVKHPREWPWNGYDELVGMRTRHTMLSMPKVLEMVGGGSREEFARDYTARIDEALSRGKLHRERHWTEAIAVGNEEYVRGIAEQICGRMRLKVEVSDERSWMVHEPEGAYGRGPSRAGKDKPRLGAYDRFSGLKIERKAGLWVLNQL
jgi:putative transposase